MRFPWTRQLRVAGLSLVCCSAAAAAHASAPDLWSSGGPFGGNVPALAVDPSNPSVVYAGTYGGGIFKSTDAGATWAASAQGLLARTGVQDIAIDAQAPSTVFVAANTGIYRSTDAGGSWVNLTPGLSGADVVEWDALAPSRIYAVFGETAYRSTDAGATWATIGAGQPGRVSAFEASPVAPATILLARSTGTAGTLWKSTDAGVTFATAGAGLSGTVGAIAFHPSDTAVVYAGMSGVSVPSAYGVYRSTDAGTTFAASTGITSPTTDLAIDPKVPTRLFATATYAGLFRSTDAGATWVTASTGLAGPYAQTVALTPGAASTLYVGTAAGTSGQPSGVFKSTDAASSWTPQNSGLTAFDISELAGSPSAPGTIYAGTDAGIFKTTDGGASWVRTSSGLPAAGRVGGISIHPSAPSVVYAAAGGDRVYRSTDAGASWLPLGSAMPTWVGDVAVDPLMPSTLYAGGSDNGGQGGVFKSTDGGDNWSRVGAGAFGPSAGPLTLSPTTPGTVFAVTATTNAQGLVRSTDGGATWSDTGLGAVFDVAFDPSNPSTVYAAAIPGVQKSTDNGTTWAAIDGLPPQVTAVVVHPTVPSTIYAGSYAGVLRSTDAGVSWSPVNHGLVNVSVSHFVIEPGGATVHAAIRSGSVWQASPPVPVELLGFRVE